HSRDDSERSQVKKLYRLPSTPQFLDHRPEAHPSCHRRQIATLYRRVCNCDMASASLKSEVNQWADNRCVSGRRQQPPVEKPFVIVPISYEVRLDEDSHTAVHQALQAWRFAHLEGSLDRGVYVVRRIKRWRRQTAT